MHGDLSEAMQDSDAVSAADTLADLEAENLRLRHELQAVRRLLDSFENLIDAIQEPRKDSEVMDLLGGILDDALLTTSGEAGSLLVLDEDTDELVFVLTRGHREVSERLKWRRLPRTAGIAGWVATNRLATIVNDVRDDERFYHGLDDELSFQTRSILAAPIIGDGRLLGVIELINKTGNLNFNNDDQTLLALLCRFAGELLAVVMDRQRRQRDVAAPAA